MPWFEQDSWHSGTKGERMEYRWCCCYRNDLKNDLRVLFFFLFFFLRLKKINKVDYYFFHVCREGLGTRLSSRYC